MARICELTGKGPRKGSIIWRSGKPKKQGGIGTHITAITKRRFMPNLQRVKAVLPSGEVRYLRHQKRPYRQGAETDLEEARGCACASGLKGFGVRGQVRAWLDATRPP